MTTASATTASATANMTASTPWYRHRWPWLLMLGPAIVVIAGVATLALAIVTDDGQLCTPAARKFGSRVVLLHPQATGEQFRTILAA
jgi:hypothetical protein